MYHKPTMCRTCLQMSRGDFKFVSLDSVDPLWESNSPNLKDQLIYIVPEMKVDSSGSQICTSCFIALRTAYEFKKMCQATEKKFQNHNYKYRRPYGVGPGSAQFHVTLNENCNYQEMAGFRCQNLNYLQTDTSIDITEHHLYDANKVIPRKQLTYLNNVTQKLPEIDVEVIVAEKKAAEKQKANAEKTEEIKSAPKKGAEEPDKKEEPAKEASEAPQKPETPEKPETPKKLDSTELRKKYNIANTNGKYGLDELKEVSQSYYADNFDNLLTCKSCSKTFSTKHWLQVHEEEHNSEKPFSCTHCSMQFIRSDSLEEHLKIHSKLVLLTPASSDGTGKPPLNGNGVKEEKPKVTDGKDANGPVKSEKEDLPTNANQAAAGVVKAESAKLKLEPTTDKDHKPKIETRSKNEDDEVPKASDTSNSVKKKLKQSSVVKYCKCLICSKICRSELQLYQHSKFCHVPNVTSSNYWANVISAIRLKCQSAPKSESAEEPDPKENSLLIATRSVKYVNVLNPYKCNICDKAFAEENFLNLHMYVHTPTILSPDNVFTANYESPEVYTCYLCNKGFSKERYLKLHNLHVHLTKTTVCKICNREFKSDFWFSKHKCQITVEPPQEVDDGRQSYPCNFCNRKFARLRFMKSHRNRMHKNLMRRNTIKIKPKYLQNRSSKTNVEMSNLELDVDPMKLCKISGASSFDDDEDVIEILSDTDDYSDEDSNESQGEEDEEEEEESQKPAIVYINKSGSPYSNLEKKGLEISSVNSVTTTPAFSFTNSGEITIRRKSIVRSAPKLQCDFCGEFIDETAYDNHIFEHNNMRLQRSLSSRKTDHNYSFDPMQDSNLDNNKIILKCHICFKAFKRKFYLISHMKTHGLAEGSQEIGEGYETEGEELDNYISENETPQKEDEEEENDYGLITIVNGIEMYECCGRSFKLKAHFFRHFKIRHPGCVYKPRYAEKKEDINEQTNVEPKKEVINAEELNVKKENLVHPETENHNEENEIAEGTRTRYNTRKSATLNEAAKDEEEDDEEEQEVSNKRKLPNQLVYDEVSNKRQKIMKREFSEAEEMLTRKRIKTEDDKMTLAQLQFSDIEFLSIDTNSSGKYKCSVCDKRFKQKCQLRDHFNVHTGDKPYKCDFCDPVRGFTQTSSLYVHFRRVHAIIMKNCLWEVYSKNGSCLICSEVFEKHAFMFKHMKDHYVEKEFQCHICEKNFNMVCHYRMHDIDPQEMQMILPQDNLEVLLTEDADDEKVKPTNDTKTKPSGIKRSETPLTEGTCDSDTATSSNEDKLSGMEDLKNINPEDLECTKCEKTFTDKQQLRFHKKSLAHIQQVQTIKKQLHDQTEETADETGEPSEKMDTIEDIQNNVDAIMKKIRTIKRHKCPMCDMAFIRKMQLKKHKKKFHRKRAVNVQQKDVTNSEQEAASNAASDAGSLSRSTTDENLAEMQDEAADSNLEIDEKDSVASKCDTAETLPNEEASETPTSLEQDENGGVASKCDTVEATSPDEKESETPSILKQDANKCDPAETTSADVKEPETPNSFERDGSDGVASKCDTVKTILPDEKDSETRTGLEQDASDSVASKCDAVDQKESETPSTLEQDENDSVASKCDTVETTSADVKEPETPNSVEQDENDSVASKSDAVEQKESETPSTLEQDETDSVASKCDTLPDEKESETLTSLEQDESDSVASKCDTVDTTPDDKESETTSNTGLQEDTLTSDASPCTFAENHETLSSSSSESPQSTEPAENTNQSSTNSEETEQKINDTDSAETEDEVTMDVDDTTDVKSTVDENTEESEMECNASSTDAPDKINEDEEMGCTFSSTDSVSECPKSIFDSDESQQKVDDKLSEMEVDVDSRNSQSLESQKESNNSSSETAAEVDELPSSDKTNADDSSSSNNLTTVGLNEESTPISDDQNVEALKGADTEPTTNCRTEYSKSIANVDETASASAVKDSKVEFLKTVSDPYACVELDK